MADQRETQVEQFTPRELAYFEYVGSQETLGEIGSRVVALEAELEGVKTGLAAANGERGEADKAFRQSLSNVREAIESDETMDPLQKYIWTASFAWASKDKSVAGNLDVVAFATGFQERVEAIQARMSEGAPIIAVGTRADQDVISGVLQGDKFVIDEKGVKAPAENVTYAWIGYKHAGQWRQFHTNSETDLRLFGQNWLEGSSPLTNDGKGLDMLRGWDEQPGFAREQDIFMGIDEIKAFLNNADRGLNDRYHGLIAAGFAGVDVGSLEAELPADLLEFRDEVAADIAEAVATNILADAINDSSDASLRNSARDHLKREEMIPPKDLLLYLMGIGISQEKLVELVNVKLKQMAERDFIVKSVTPQVLPDDQVADRVASVFVEVPEVELVG